MTIWEVCHYVFPDDGGETLERVLDDLSPIIRAGLVGSFPDYSVSVMTERDAFHVLLSTSERGVEGGEDGILYVPDSARDDCVRAMSEGGIPVERWLRFLDMEFASAASRDAFDALSSKHGFSRQI